LFLFTNVSALQIDVSSQTVKMDLISKMKYNKPSLKNSKSVNIIQLANGETQAPKNK